MKYLAEVGAQANCYKIILNCSEGNSEFYQKCGFRKTGELEMRLDID